MPTKMPDPLDALVGARIRVFRIHRRISQTDLANQIGVTFQQVQKYEKGTNRIGASRLSRIAGVLGISVGELFESPGEKSSIRHCCFGCLPNRAHCGFSKPTREPPILEFGMLSPN